VVVASSNDPYVSLERARAFAAAWGSTLMVIDDAGHVTDASGYGEWPEGEQMLQAFCEGVRGG
jgi:predicted alpha/beta hydrolase family esterase